LRQGIPFSENKFEVVYHSHVLEHFDKTNGALFLNECFRVLKSGGVLRVVVPDLEQIAKEYIMQIDRAKEGDVEARKNYDWILLELIDQLARVEPGGEMLKYWAQPTIENEAYVKSRVGDEFISARRKILAKNKRGPQQKNSRRSITLSNLRHLFLSEREKEYLKIGEFKSLGESHFWMYDEYSLSSLLKDIGFSKIQKMNPQTSLIKDWNLYSSLDLESGIVRKPDSLFLEAIKK
jgi:SAM-dependent methyltransferase